MSWQPDGGRRIFGFVVRKLANGSYFRVRTGSGLEHNVARKQLTVELG